MNCPACGSSSRRRLIGSTYECTSTTLYPALGNIAVEGICGERYLDKDELPIAPIKRHDECGDPIYRAGPGARGTHWYCRTCDCKVEDSWARHLREEQEEYRRLPAISADQLASWINGSAPADSFIDGKTHQTLNWTGEGVANLLASMVGRSGDSYFIGGAGPIPEPLVGARAPSVVSHPLDIRPGTVLLRPSGAVVKVEMTASGEYGTFQESIVDHLIVAPKDPFSQRITPGSSEVRLDRAAFAWLRRNYAKNLAAARERSRIEAGQARQERIALVSRVALYVALSAVAAVVVIILL